MSHVITLHSPAPLPWALLDSVLFKDEQVIARFDNDDFDTATNIANAAYAFNAVSNHEKLVTTLKAARAEITALHAEVFNKCEGDCSYEQFISHIDTVLAKAIQIT